MDRLLRIWFIEYDEDGNEIGRGVYAKSYLYPGAAYNAAMKRYGDRKRFKFIIAPYDPFVEHFEERKCDIYGRVFKEPMSSYGHPEGGSVTIVHERKNNKRAGPFERLYPCEECITKVHNYIEELKEENSNNE